jgi:fatty acid desaturase
MSFFDEMKWIDRTQSSGASLNPMTRVWPNSGSWIWSHEFHHTLAMGLSRRHDRSGSVRLIRSTIDRSISSKKLIIFHLTALKRESYASFSALTMAWHNAAPTPFLLVDCKRACWLFWLIVDNGRLLSFVRLLVWLIDC